MLTGLDDVAWSGLTHAYGSAEDTAVLLRQAMSQDVDVASAAISELHGSIFHQGTVYPATVAAVPFLAELAQDAPRCRVDVVWMLGMLADPRHAYGESFPAVAAAVAGQVQRLVALLADGDVQVREAAAYAVVQAGATAEPLWRRWAVETEPAVGASLALALGRTDADAAGSVLGDAARHGKPAVRVAAAVALLRAGRAWPEGTVAALVDAVDDGARVQYCWAARGDWSEELLVASSEPVAVDILGHMLRGRNPKTRQAGIWAMSERCNARRSAPQVFVPMVLPALEDPDPDVRREAIGALRRAGNVAGRFTDVLYGLAARFPDVAGEPGFTAEYHAVETLLRLGDPRWIEPVCAAAAAGHRLGPLLTVARFSPAVFARVRIRLAADPARADVLAGVVGQWGTDGTDAVPELLAAMPHAGRQVAGALLLLGHDDPAAVPYLRMRVAETGDLQAAAAIWRMTGDPHPMLETLDGILSRGKQARFVSTSFVTDLAGTLQPLLAAARVHLTGAAARTHPQRETQILAARVVATADGPEPVLATVRAILAAGNTPARAAADLIADLAQDHPAAMAALIPLLRDRLEDRWNRLAAARALARLGVPTAELTEPLVRGITDYAGRFAIPTILELHAVETIPALVALAGHDERLNVTGFADDIVWTDELLQERIRAAVIDLRDM